jgi:hypothetical protein
MYYLFFSAAAVCTYGAKSGTRKLLAYNQQKKVASAF